MTQITQTTLGNFREARGFLIMQDGVVRVSKIADAGDNGAAEYGGFDANDAQIARLFKGDDGWTVAPVGGTEHPPAKAPAAEDVEGAPADSTEAAAPDLPPTELPDDADEGETTEEPAEEAAEAEEKPKKKAKKKAAAAAAPAPTNAAEAREHKGFDMMIHQNKGKALRVKKYGKFETAIRAGKSEVMRPAVDKIEIVHRDTEILAATLTRTTPTEEGEKSEPVVTNAE